MTTVYTGTEASLNGYVITNLMMSDRIQISDLPAATANISISGDKLLYGNGDSITIDNLGPGRLIIRGIGTTGTEIRLQEDAHNDFSGDGRSDMLLRDSTSNYLTEWVGSSDGSLINNGASSTYYLTPDWHVAGTGDFNGDGRVDLLLKSDSGWVTDWLANADGSFTNNGANASLYFTSNWQIAGTGDFTGDGRDGFLLRDPTSGWLTEWVATANGGFTNNGANATLYFTPDWHVVATGDFNGDGNTDILLRNDAGWVTDWLANANHNGGFTNNGANCSFFLPSDWHIVGTGDFNGDGSTDILLRNDAGWVTDWLANANGGFTNNGANCSFFLSSDWHIASIGDFNGDGIDDILLRNDSGQTTEWLGTSTGGFINNGAHFSAYIAPNWHIQDPSVVLL